MHGHRPTHATDTTPRRTSTTPRRATFGQLTRVRRTDGTAPGPLHANTGRVRETAHTDDGEMVRVQWFVALGTSPDMCQWVPAGDLERDPA